MNPLHGIEKREPWTVSRIMGSPEPPSPYIIEPMFPRLKEFREPLEFVAMPGSDRFLIIEHERNIFSIPNDPACRTPDLFVDMRKINSGVKEVYSLAFHPGFKTNRFVYVWYILKAELPDGTIISRFKVTDTNPPKLDLSTEQIVFTWKSGGHNGGCIRFGPDGYLYLSTGDGAGPDPPDPLNTGQDISDVLSSILRIDIDHAENGKAYRVPPDNPFINTPGARPEVWAYGLRNPWRMSFDRKTGDLWVGDVGWELWEMIHRVQRGGNYGWSILEGSHQAIKPDGKHGPTPIVPPVIEHPHSEAASITGGCVYRGKRLPELVGSYIYGDWETRKIWELRYDGSRVTKARELVSTPYRIVSFGEDNDGELYIVDFGGTIQRLAPNPAADKPSAFPRKLSETGLFTSTPEQKPARGVLPYEINAHIWTDYAQSERWVGFPGTSRASLTNDGRWQFPPNAVLAKTLSLEMEAGNPSTRRKIETQILHFTGDTWGAYSFQWNDEQTDATLLPASGAEQEFTIKDAAAPGGKRHQTWRFHSRAECLRCHNPWCNTALAFNPLQLSKSVRFAIREGPIEHQLTDPGAQPSSLSPRGMSGERGRPMLVHNTRAEQVSPPLPGPLLPSREERETPVHFTAKPPLLARIIHANQLVALRDLGLLEHSCLPKTLPPPLMDPYDPSANLNARARSYLHINCSHCHREHAGGSIMSFMNFDVPLEKAALVGKIPMQGNMGIPNAQVIAGGDPSSSVLFYRFSKLGKGHMPYLGSSWLDPHGVTLICDWIKQLPPAPKTNHIDYAAAAKRKAAQAAALARLRANNLPDKDETIDQMLTTPSGALSLLSAVNDKSFRSELCQTIISKGTSASEPMVRDLFERFLPDEKRVKVLGLNVRPETILALKGDADRGHKLFSQEGRTQCQTCHRAQGVGRDFGPDLSLLGQKYTRAQILENVLEPSKTIDPKYIAYNVETKDDTSHTGFLLAKSAESVVLKEANADEVRLPAADIKHMEAQRLSLMPEGLLQGMTAQEAADLIEYLQSLR